MKVQQQLSDIIDTIKEMLPAHKIYVIGWYANNKKFSIFNSDQRLPDHAYHYDFFIVSDHEHLHDAIDSCELVCASIAPVTILAEHSFSFQKNISEGHPFFLKLLASATLVYDNGQAVPETEGKNWSDYLQERNDRTFKAAEGYFASALYLKQRASNEAAAFLLYKATEGFFLTILQSATAHNFKNLQTLHEYRFQSLAFSEQIHPLFFDTEEVKKTFLKFEWRFSRAYTEPEISLSEREYSLLIDDIYKLKNVAEEFKKCRLTSYENQV